MKSIFVLLVVAATALAYSIDNSNPTNRRCVDNAFTCVSSPECCSGCCVAGKCDTRERCSVAKQGACEVHYCPPEKECYLNKVQCITAPCPPIPACRDKQGDNDYDYK